MTISTALLAVASIITLQSPQAQALMIQNASNASMAGNTTAATTLSTKTVVDILATSTSVATESQIADVSKDNEPKPMIASSTETTEQQVRSYFADIPALIDVAQCESNFTQTNANGTVFRGVINPEDLGVMQINQYYNGESAEHLGYNIKTLAGNLAFARHLYNVYGLSPWSASEKCWAPKAGINDNVALK